MNEEVKTPNDFRPGLTEAVKIIKVMLEEEKTSYSDIAQSSDYNDPGPLIVSGRIDILLQCIEELEFLRNEQPCTGSHTLDLTERPIRCSTCGMRVA